MKRLLLLGIAVLGLVIGSASPSQAFHILPPCAHGFSGLKAYALNKHPWIHFHGPLYNYGPYNFYGPGYQMMSYYPHPHSYYVPSYALPGSPAAMGGHPHAYGHAPAAPAQMAYPMHAQVASPSDFYQAGYFGGQMPAYMGQAWPAR